MLYCNCLKRVDRGWFLSHYFFNQFTCYEKSKITKILNLEENQFGKSIITWQNQIKTHQKRMDKNCVFGFARSIQTSF